MILTMLWPKLNCIASSFELEFLSIRRKKADGAWNVFSGFEWLAVLSIPCMNLNRVWNGILHRRYQAQESRIDCYPAESSRDDSYGHGWYAIFHEEENWWTKARELCHFMNVAEEEDSHDSWRLSRSEDKRRSFESFFCFSSLAVFINTDMVNINENARCWYQNTEKETNNVIQIGIFRIPLKIKQCRCRHRKFTLS